MLFKDYYRKTLYTTKFLWKINIIIFSSILGIVALIFESHPSSTKLFDLLLQTSAVYSITILIWILAVFSAYFEAKSIIKFYDSIPDFIRSEFKLELIESYERKRYEYLKYLIISTNIENPIHIRLFKGNILEILLPIPNSSFSYNQENQIEFNKRYKKDKIVLYGCSIGKILNRKEWERIRTSDLNQIINQLKTVARKEK